MSLWPLALLWLGLSGLVACAWVLWRMADRDDEE